MRQRVDFILSSKTAQVRQGMHIIKCPKDSPADFALSKLFRAYPKHKVSIVQITPQARYQPWQNFKDAA